MESTDEASGGRSVQTILLLCLSLCLSLVSARLPACPPARLPACLSVCPPAWLPAWLSVCLPARLAACLYVCLTVLHYRLYPYCAWLRMTESFLGYSPHSLIHCNFGLTGGLTAAIRLHRDAEKEVTGRWINWSDGVTAGVRRSHQWEAIDVSQALVGGGKAASHDQARHCHGYRRE
jgi:hypothetical protein